MKIYKVDLEEHIFVVIAESAKEAKKIIEEYHGNKIEVIEITNRDLKKGVVLNYDYEDFYWNE